MTTPATNDCSANMGGPGDAPTSPALIRTCVGGPDMDERTCSVDGCEKPRRKREWCNPHYCRWMRSGDPAGVDPPRGLLRKFLESVLDGSAPVEPNGCILWPFGTRMGYAVIGSGGKRRSVGHIVLEHFEGPRPSPDHSQGHAPHEVCGNRHCVAPGHLSWQTHQEQTQSKLDDDVVPNGERHADHRFSDEQVRDAVRRVRAGETCDAVAKSIGAKEHTVWKWSTGRGRKSAFREDQ